MAINNKYVALGISIFVGFTLLDIALLFTLKDGFSLPLVGEPTSNQPGQSTSTPAPIVTITVNIGTEILKMLGWFVSGFVVGRALKSDGLIHGAIIGGLGGLLSQILSASVFDMSEIDYLYFWIIWGSIVSAFMCSLAGGVGELVGRTNNS